MTEPDNGRRSGPSAPWPLSGPPLDSPLRGLAAVGAIGEAVAHLPVIADHLSEAPYVGVLFVLLAIAGFGLGTLLLLADSPATWRATALVSALALIGYLLSRTVGLPQIHDDIGSWNDPLGIVAISCEALMLITAAVVVVRRR